jgi:ABC-type iron transport system FetAB ATPase subunit
MFGAEQLKYLYGWLKTALECLQTQDFRPGQVVALTGPKDCGKSFVQDNIFTPILGGRSAEPYHTLSA